MPNTNTNMPNLNDVLTVAVEAARSSSRILKGAWKSKPEFRIDSSDDILLDEAGTLMQQYSFGLDEMEADHMLQMKSAYNLEKQAEREKDQAGKFLGIF